MIMRIWVAALLSGVSTFAAASTAYAQASEYNIPAGSLKSALDAYAKRTGAEIIAKEDELRGVRSPGARGALSSKAALDAILSGTGFRAEHDVSGAVAIVKASADPKVDAADDEQIVVTGSRIRGATSTSPTIRITQEDIRNSGLPTLGDVMRSLPQNFAGGQNPGVASGAQAGGVDNYNVSSSSTINLRGLGPDATLTLLNGHRLSYDYTFQGVDIATIPIDAIDRVEIVADGASAIYGSDAVAGVANIVLRKDYDGLTTSARFGASTDGGNVQQEYSVTGGTVWDGGGLIAVYDYQKFTPIQSRQRSYTQAAQGEQILFPGVSQHSAIVAGHQRLTEALTFSVDGTFGRRTTERVDVRTATLPPTQAGQVAATAMDSYSVSPRLDLSVGERWIVSLFGTYAGNSTDVESDYYSNGVALFTDTSTLKNKTRAIELSADGVLARLNGNGIGLAVGLGYRANSLVQDSLSVSPVYAPSALYRQGDANSKYAFAELQAPLITPANDAAISRLVLTAAVRYERYSSGDDLATPKLGVSFAPIDGLEFKGSWGKSFKAPTLVQLSDPPLGYLYDAEQFGFPIGGTGIIIDGGNPDLRSERAETWTITATATPNFAPGLRIELSYFDVRYKDRVIRAPITIQSSAASNPAYQFAITRDPTAAQLQAAIDLLARPPSNYSSGPYDPADVVAILDNRAVNVAEQAVHGLDLQSSYGLSGVAGGRLTISGAASYLNSRRSVLPETPEAQLSGTIFNPPKWRLRGSFLWAAGIVNLGAAINYRSGLQDVRRSPSIKIPGVVTVDLSARITSIAAAGPFEGLEVAFTVLNALNRKPPRIWTSNLTARPYDSTNDSPVGRFVGMTLTKRW